MSGRAETEHALPHSCEAERAILGAILLANPGTVNVLDAFACLTPATFFLPQHQTIFAHMKHLRELGEPTNDLVVLCDSLTTANDLEAAGGSAYVSSIPDGMARVTNLSHYVEIVVLKAQLRHRAYVAQTILEKLVSANGDAADVLREASDLSAQLREEVGQNHILNFRSGYEFAASTEERVQWIAPGYVAKGAITELGARIKMGKTTLVLNLVRAAAEEHAFLGKPTLKAATVYLTEQPAASFRQAMERVGLLGREDFHLLLHNEVRVVTWPGIVSAAIAECRRVAASILVVDTLAQFARLIGDSENNSGDALAAMLPLQQAVAEGLAVIIVRHERKSGGEVGDSGRGSSAFAGAADIVLSLRRNEGNSRKAIRLLQAVSRFSETPAEQVIELRENVYISLGEPHEAAAREAKTSIIAISPKSESAAVGLELLIKSSGIARATAQRAIDELRREGKLIRVGAGKRGKRYQYFAADIPFCPTPSINGQEVKKP